MKTSKITVALFLGLSVSMMATAQKKTTGTQKKAKEHFETTPRGLEYWIVKDVPGTQKPAVGDFVKIYITNEVHDSVIYDSRKMMGSEPVEFQLGSPQYNGDVLEGITMMTPGDSAIFRTPVDSLMKTSKGGQLPPFLKPGDKMVFKVVLVSVTSKEDKMKADAAKAAQQGSIDDKILQDYFAKNNLKPMKTASGLYYTIQKEGTGANAQPGQDVSVNYTGKTLDGKAFDSNVDSNFHHVQPFSFPLGRGHVIKGWDEGVALLKKGGQATLYIPSTLGYGAHSPTPAIPANGILVFNVEITDIKEAQK